MASEFRGKIQPHTHSEIEKSPYPPSPVIQSVEWDWSADRHAEIGKGSDLWPVTWAADDNLYTAWGDGGGFGGDNTVGRVWLGFGRMEGMPPDFRGTNVWGGKDPENRASFGGYPTGLISVDGVLYCWVHLIGGEAWFPPQHESIFQLIWSEDLGKTWQKADWTVPGADFGEIGFLNAGKDYQDRPDDCIYMYGVQRTGWIKQIFTHRVARDRLREAVAYQTVKAFDGNGGPKWGPGTGGRKPIFEDANGTMSVPRVVYNAGLDRYILTVGHCRTEQLGIFDAPNPWGPWTTVAYYSDWGGYQSGEGAYALGWDFPTKWMSEDGKTMWCVYSGSDRGGTLPDGARILDRFHIAKATLKLRKPR